MRKPLLLALLLALASSVSTFADPAISLLQAAQMAEKAKTDRPGGEAVFVQSLVLERGSLFGGKTAWVAKWSAPLPANDPGNREVGIEIAMDGAIKRIVKEPFGKR